MARRPLFNKKNYMKISGSRHSALDKARGRIAIISACFVIAYMLIGVRVFDLTVIQGHPAAPSDSVIISSAEPGAKLRADIVDRNGVILATTLDTASLYADPALVPDADVIAKDLVGVFPDLDYGTVLQNLQKKSRFVWIKRSLTPAEQYKVLELGHPALGFQQERRRIYPQGALAAHMAGYTSIDGQGLAGIERSFDSLLAQGGEPLRLTLDVRLQHILRREAKAAMDEYSGIGAAGVILDVGTGEILAAVSLPDFDPHNAGDAKPEQIFNNLTLGVYELGSTFKIFSTAALLETTDVPMGYKFDAREPLKRGRFKISDYHPEKRELTIPEVFMYSSNIGSALMGEMVGTENLQNFYRDLGLFDPLPLQINEVGKPLLPPVWRDINTLTASYGHGIAVTPLQMVVAAAAIANGGVWESPSLVVNDMRMEDGDKSQKGPDLRVISPQTSHRMRQLMRLVVTDGTGKSAEVAGYNVGGKTGTAEKIVGGKYDHKKKVSSFIGFFPMEAPRYAVFIMVDEPKGTKKSWGYATGGWVAAPAVGHTIKSMVSVLGIPPSHTAAAQDMVSTLKTYINMEGGHETH